MSLTTSHRAIVLFACAAVAIGGLWWKCARDPAINFLPADNRAEWIIFPMPVDAGAHRIAMIDTVFRREFQLNTSSKSAQLQLRAARRVELKINGKSVEVHEPENWKEVKSMDVAGFLQSGSNKIEARVLNDDAPPALWFWLETGEKQLHSDDNWEASLAGSAWRRAAIAIAPRHPQPGNLLFGGEKTLAVLPRIWPAWAAFLVAGVLIALFGGRLIGTISKETSVQTAIIAGVIAIAWVVLFWNNTRLLPFYCGYDSNDHVAYIKYVQERRALPLPTEGFEAFQAPLYYVLSATALSIAKLRIADPGSIALLRTLTMLFGIGHFAIVSLCLRLLFPDRPGPQMAGLAIAAFLPMQLYLSHYVTNETLAAALVSAAIYFALRILKKQSVSIWDYAAFGLCIGAAMLTKATGLLLVPPLFGALMWKMAQDKIAITAAIQRLATVLIAVFITCSWYYIWIWRQFGKPIVGNWERAFGFNWWQDPGFHTAAHYLRFGRALVDPLFSSYNSFADGIYSTLWGDGLGGGLSDILSRTPWNYDLMVGGYLLALVPTVLIAIGAAVAIYRFARQPSAQWFLLIGFSAAISVALVFMTLRVASYAQVKAFYGLSALVPICAFIAVVWAKLETAPRLLRLTVHALLVIWAFNSFLSVWIPDSAMTHTYAARRLTTEDRKELAVKEATEAARREPFRALAQCLLAAVLDDAGQRTEAIEQTKRGIQLEPTNEYCQIQEAINLAKENRLGQAMTIIQRVIADEPENARAFNILFTLAREVTRPEDAIGIGKDTLAVSPFDGDSHFRVGLAAGQIGDFVTATHQFGYALLLKPNDKQIADKLRTAIMFAVKAPNAADQLANIAAAPPQSPLLLDELAWIFATSPDGTLRNGPRAVELAGRACLLTGGNQPESLATLAAAYAEDGKFDDAIETARKALALAQAQGDVKTIGLSQKFLTSFQNQQPYRDQP